MQQALLKISGKVQGVFFRASAKEKADKLGLSGHARNLPDGGVEILIQGKEESIEEFIEWAKKGPELAEVEEANIQLQEIKQTKSSFEIL
jgi:acylphosphatase